MSFQKGIIRSRHLEPFEPRVLLSTSTDFPLLTDINPTGDGVAANNPPSTGYRPIPENGVEFRGKTYFAADDGVHGRELWSSDGTAAGTRMVVDLMPGATGSVPIGLIVHGDALFFAAVNDAGIGHDRWLFKTDGTAAGTVHVRSARDGEVAVRGSLNPQVFFEFKGRLAFLGAQNYFQQMTGTSLWMTDGTAEGTYRAGDTIETDTGYPANVAVSGDYLYFSAYTGAGSASLCRHDGTNWTELVRAANPRFMADLNGSLIFSYTPGDLTADQLWVADSAGARRIPGPRMVYGTARLGSYVYFGSTAANSGGGYSLWRTDGTPAGTTEVSATGAFTSAPGQLRVADGRLWFSAATAAAGQEPWVSDGTPAGTRTLGDLNPGSASSITNPYPGLVHDPYFVAGPDGYVYFQATTAAQGTELFRSDGTAAGTALVADFMPGSADSMPGPFMTVAGKLFAAVGDPTNGHEWRLIATDTLPPAIASATFQWSPQQAAQLRFTEDVSATLDGADLRVINLDAGVDVPAAQWTLLENSAGAGTLATLLFSSPLPDGNYQVRLFGGGVEDAAGNPMADFKFGFFVLAGDANRDRVVNFTDLLAVARNYNGTGKTWADGDFDGNGNVNFNDLLLLARAYNTVLAPPPAPAPVMTAAAPALASEMLGTAPATPFSTTRVETPLVKVRPAPTKPRPAPAKAKGPRTK